MSDEESLLRDDHYRHAVTSLEHTIEHMKRCPPEERQRLRREFDSMQGMLQKLTKGRVEIAVFGEISTGKSALINALVGQQVAAVDVQGGWTKDVWHVAWEANGWRIPGLAQSEMVLVDTPGLNEVGGQQRADMAHEAAERSDLILFVTDSDLTETEYTALLTLAGSHKPMILVVNKIDLYSRAQRERLLEVVRDERLGNILAPEDVVPTSADPREVEYIIESADGTTRSEWRRPPADVGRLKSRILEVLEKDGSALLALNAAMYAADRSDRIATLRVRMRETKANQTIWSYAVLKAAVVSFNLIPVVDVLGGAAVDATMVATLSHIYGLQMSWTHARRLVTSIVAAAGWVMLAEFGTHFASMAFKALTFGYGTVLTAIPQGAAAGYGSYIVGQAAKYYFEHGSSWGPEGPKTVVKRILDETDKQSVLERLKDEIRKKLTMNRHVEQE